jgi:hypothetical protein
MCAYIEATLCVKFFANVRIAKDLQTKRSFESFELPLRALIFKNYVKQNASMSYQEDDPALEGEQVLQNRLQMIDTLKASIIEMGRNLGYEVIENYDLGSGPIHVCWIFKPGSESLPNIRLGFILSCFK